MERIQGEGIRKMITVKPFQKQWPCCSVAHRSGERAGHLT